MNQVIEIPLVDIHADEEFNCRGSIVPIDVLDLARDIAAEGLISPVVVYEYDEEMAKSTGKKFKLLAGFRRFLAHRVNKADTIKALVHDKMPDLDAKIFNLKENLIRKDLNILQEANTVEYLKLKGLTEEAIAFRLNKSRGWVQVRLRLKLLPVEIQECAAAGIINTAQINSIYKVKDPKQQIQLAVKFKKSHENATTEKVHIPVRKTNSTRARNKTEMSAMLNLIYSELGASFTTRVLAWACGNISDLEIYQDLNEVSNGRITIPEEFKDDIS